MNTKFTKTQDSVLNGLLRHILTAAGGALVARGSLAESARREWSGVGRDSLQPASGGALVHSTRCHHLQRRASRSPRRSGSLMGRSEGGYLLGLLVILHFGNAFFNSATPTLVRVPVLVHFTPTCHVLYDLEVFTLKHMISR